MGFKANSLQVKEDTRKYSKPQTEDLLLNKDDLEFFLYQILLAPRGSGQANL